MRRGSFIFALVLLAACGDDGSVGGADVGAADADAGLPDAGDAGADAADADSSAMDASTDSGGSDAVMPDADASADATPTDATPPIDATADAAVDGAADTGSASDTGPLCVSCAWTVCGPTGCDPQALSSGVDVTCGRRATGALHCWGTSPGPALAMSVGTVDHDVNYDDGGCAVLGTGELLCWSSGGTPALVSGVTDAAEVAHTNSQICIRRTGGSVACAAGVGSSFSTVTGISTANSLAGGFLYMCAALTDGTARCWGNNIYGSLGDGTMTTSATPVTVVGVTDIAALDSSRRHVCARTNGGQLYCWGDNTNGQAGTGASGMFAPTPARVGSFSDVVDVACGDDHTCVVRGTGQVVCWGNNRNGELGSGSTGGADRRTPGAAVVGISDARAVASGDNHTCALRASGVSCWGAGRRGQLGNGGSADSATPVDVLPPS